MSCERCLEHATRDRSSEKSRECNMRDRLREKSCDRATRCPGSPQRRNRCDTCVFKNNGDFKSHQDVYIQWQTLIDKLCTTPSPRRLLWHNNRIGEINHRESNLRGGIWKDGKYVCTRMARKKCWYLWMERAAAAKLLKAVPESFPCHFDGSLLRLWLHLNNTVLSQREMSGHYHFHA